MSFNKRSEIIGVFIIIGLFWSTNCVWAESVDITTLYSTPINPQNGVHPLWTPVQHFRGKTFCVVPSLELRPMVTSIDDQTGNITTVYLDPGADYKASTDGHNRFTMGIDPDGYLHIIGDMHGYGPSAWSGPYVERYQHQSILYWKSNKALDVTGGFSFCGSVRSNARLPGVEWGGDSRLFNDKNGILYFSSRVRAFMGGRLEGSEPFIAYGVYRYDHTTGIWSALGSTVESAVPDANSFNKVLYWEHTLGFEAYQSNPRFDSRNRLHFSIAGNTAHTEGSGLIYAVSDDLGKSWKKADGTPISGLPLRGKDGDSNQGDLVARSKNVAQQSSVYIDKEGKIALNVEGQWKTWDKGTWQPINGGIGLLGPDGMLTCEWGPVLTRSSGIGHPVTSFDTGFGQVFSLSELALQNTGALYGVGLPAGTNFVSAKRMWVFKAVFDPAENIAKAGTASASSEATQAAQAFDGKQDTKWSTKAGAPGWISYALPSGKFRAICRYELTSALDSPKKDPKSWDLEGSIDGLKWVILDSRNEQLFEARNETKCFAIASCKNCAYYRLSVKKTRGEQSGGIQLAELKLLAVDSAMAPTAPKVFSAQGGNGRVWLSWTRPPGAASYIVKHSRTAVGPYVVLAKDVTDAGDFCDTTCSNGEPCFYIVSAVNSEGESPGSIPVGAMPHLMSPRPPIIQSAIGGNKKVILNWLPLWPDATTYTVKRSEATGGPYVVVAQGVPGLSYTDIKLVNDKSYYYVVIASNRAGGESQASREISGKPFRWTRILHYESVGKRDLGTASASSENAGETASGAFDGILNHKWLFPKRTGWLQYSFAEGNTLAVTRYQIISCEDGPNRDPKDWEFLGSADGVTWETLDIQKNQMFSERNATNTYSFENTKSYHHYRLNISKVNGSDMGALAELVFWGDDPVIERPPAFTPFPSSKPINPDP